MYLVMSGNPEGTKNRVITRETRVYPGNRVKIFIKIKGKLKLRTLQSEVNAECCLCNALTE